MGILTFISLTALIQEEAIPIQTKALFDYRQATPILSAPKKGSLAERLAGLAQREHGLTAFVADDGSAVAMLIGTFEMLDAKTGAAITESDQFRLEIRDGKMTAFNVSPETVTVATMIDEDNQATSTLYQVDFALPAGITRIRVFVWHVNSLGGNRIFSLFGRVTSGTGTVSDRRVVNQVSSIYPPIGLCLAKVHLWSEWDAALANVPLSQTEAAIWQKGSVGNNRLIGSVTEFDVELTSATTLCLRTTVSTGTAAPGTWNQKPAIDPGHHVRGFWPFSELTMDGGAIDVKAIQGTPTRRIIEAVANGGPEMTAFAKTTGDTHGTARGNRGCYGANLLYDFSVTNSGNQAYPLFVYGQSRNVSNKDNLLGYFGPLSILSPAGFTKRGVTQLRCDGSSPQPGDYVRLTTSDGTNETPVSIPSGQTSTYRIGAAVAGAASSPFNIAFCSIAYQLTEPPQ